jgi:hypothetical protein
MVELELSRDAAERRLYTLEGVGTLRLVGWSARRAEAVAGASRWRFVPNGVFGRRVIATDEHGSTVGEFHQNAIRRGGVLRWSDASYELRSASMWRERYALCEGDSELALLDARSWGRHPVRLTLQTEVDHGLLLFAAFVARRLAAEAASTAGAGASTAAIG